MSHPQSASKYSLPGMFRRSTRMLKGLYTTRCMKSAAGLAVAFCLTPSSCPGMSLLDDDRLSQVVIRADLSLMTDFWRSQFRNVAEEASNPEFGQTPASPERASATAIATTSAVTDELVPEVDGDLPIATESDAMDITETDTEASGMSDWESAESRSGSLRGKTFTTDGPSMVTAVVGVVGLIVVFGAYLKGKS